MKPVQVQWFRLVHSALFLLKMNRADWAQLPFLCLKYLQCFSIFGTVLPDMMCGPINKIKFLGNSVRLANLPKLSK